MRLTLALERNPMPAGEPTWMTTTVENVGDRLAIWSASCGHAVSVFGTVPDVRLRYGRQGIDEVGRMKDRIMGSARIEDGVMQLGFTPKSAVDGGLEVGEYACADLFDGRELKPGATIVERSRWSGFAMRSRMLPPTAPVPLRSRFRWWREPVGGPGPELGPGSELEAVLGAWIEERGAPIRIHPGEAVDIALADPVFGPWLLARPRSGISSIVELDLAKGVWRVGMTTHNPVQRDRVALVDASTGEILAIVGPVD